MDRHHVDGCFIFDDCDRYNLSDRQLMKDLKKSKLPLHIAIAEKLDTSLIKKFMTAEQIKKVDKGIHNCLHIAVSVAPYNSEVIEKLLNMNVDVNARNHCGDTPLHLAAGNPLCDLNLVKMLIDKCADVNMKNHYYETPIFAFIRRCKEIDKCEEYFKIIQFLILNGAQINIQNRMNDYLVHIAASLPSFINLKLIKELSNHDACLCNYSNGGETILHKAVKDKNNIKLVQFLVKEHPELLIIKNNQGHTPLHTAVYNCSSCEIIEELIINGADVNEPDKLGNYPIHFVQSSPICIISCLIKHGSDVNCVNKCRRTPLMVSIISKFHKLESIRALINYGANTNKADIRGYSPLHYALKDKDVKSEIVQLLLENGADPLNTNFYTAPFLSFCSENIETAEIYIQYALIHVFDDRKVYRKPFKKLMSFECYDDKKREKFSILRDNCVDGLLLMKKDRLNKSLTLYKFVRSQCYKACDESDSDPFVKEILDRFHSEKYKGCKYLLLGSIKEKRLAEYVPTLKIYTNVPVSIDAKQNTSTKDPEQSTSAQNSVRCVSLNHGAIVHLVKFLDKESLMNLALSFSHH